MKATQKEFKLQEGIVDQAMMTMDTKIKEINKDLEHHIGLYRQEQQSVAQKRDILNVYTEFKNYTSLEDLKKFRNELNPVINESHALLTSFRTEFETIKEIVRRFDEVISGKANKFAIVELRHEFEEKFIKADRHNEMVKGCEEIIK